MPPHRGSGSRDAPQGPTAGPQSHRPPTPRALPASAHATTQTSAPNSPSLLPHEPILLATDNGRSPVLFALASPRLSPIPTASIQDADLPFQLGAQVIDTHTTSTSAPAKPVTAKLTKRPRLLSQPRASPSSSSLAHSPPLRPPSGSPPGPSHHRPFRGRSGTPDPQTVHSAASRSSSPPAPITSAETLVADVSRSRSRVILTKTHVLYPPPGVVPFARSVVLGFRGVFHPVAPGRIKDAEIRMQFASDAGEGQPTIKAISPDSPATSRPGSGSSSQVTRTTHLIGNLSLGFVNAGELSLDAGEETNTTYNTSATCFGSGVETSHALFTLTEDPGSHGGVDPFIDCAVLLQLPSEAPNLAFHAEVSVEADLHRGGPTETLRRLVGTPRTWTLQYDGATEFGALRTQDAILTADSGTQTSAGGAMSHSSGSHSPSGQASQLVNTNDLARE